MNGFAIRCAERRDVEALLTMQQALQDHLAASNTSLWPTTKAQRLNARQALQAELDAAEVRWLVACAEDELPIAMISGHICHQVDHAPPCYGLIGRLYVQPPWRGQGVGRACVAEICRFFAQHGAGEIALRYVVGNMEAERFWTHLGLVPRIITAGTTRAALEQTLASHHDSG